MRWQHSPPPHHKGGDRRTVRKFLLLPKRIKLETRWFEMAEIIQVYVGGRYMWQNEKWI